MNPNEIRQQEVDQVKANLAKSANLRNLVMESLETQQHLVEGIKKVPQAEIISQAQQLENIILPKILQNKGDGEDYRYWKGVLDTMNWALFLVDYVSRLEQRLVRTRHNNMYFKNLVEKLDAELQHYTTLERLMMNDLIRDAIKNQP